MAPLFLLSTLLLLATISTNGEFVPNCMQFTGNVTVKKGDGESKEFFIPKTKGGLCDFKDEKRAYFNIDLQEQPGSSLTLHFKIADDQLSFIWREIEYSEGSESWYKDYVIDWKGMIGKSFLCAQKNTFQLQHDSSATTTTEESPAATTAGGSGTFAPATDSATTAAPATDSATTAAPATDSATTAAPTTDSATTAAPTTDSATTAAPATVAPPLSDLVDPAGARSYLKGSASIPQDIEITLSGIVLMIDNGPTSAGDAGVAVTYCRSAPDMTWVLAGSAAVSAVLVLGLAAVALRVF